MVTPASLEHFQAKWMPVRVKKMRQEKLEPEVNAIHRTGSSRFFRQLDQTIFW
jgi:hypothetical protein